MLGWLLRDIVRLGLRAVLPALARLFIFARGAEQPTGADLERFAHTCQTRVA